MTIETTDTTERARPAMVILKELARQQPDLLRSVVKHVIAELAMAGEMSRLGAFARLAKELFPAPVPERRAVPAEDLGQGPGDMCASGPKPVATGKRQLELPTGKPAAKTEDEEEVEEEDVEDEEEEEPEEEEEEEEEETPPPFDPVAKKKKKLAAKGKK